MRKGSVSGEGDITGTPEVELYEWGSVYESEAKDQKRGVSCRGLFVRVSLVVERYPVQYLKFQAMRG